MRWTAMIIGGHGFRNEIEHQPHSNSSCSFPSWGGCFEWVRVMQLTHVYHYRGTKTHQSRARILSWNALFYVSWCARSDLTGVILASKTRRFKNRHTYNDEIFTALVCESAATHPPPLDRQSTITIGKVWYVILYNSLWQSQHKFLDPLLCKLTCSCSCSVARR